MEGVDVAEWRSATEAPHGEDLWLARRAAWFRWIKPAQIAFGGSVLDCALLDTSPGGARVYLPAGAEVTEIATLRLRGGESWTVRRQWQQGSQAGFEVVGRAFPRAVE